MRRIISIIAGSMLLVGCFGSSGDVAVEDTLEGVARAFQSTNENHLIGGSPVARAQVGDYVIENENIRVIVQAPGRRWYGGVNPYGGSIIDADIQRAPGEAGASHFEAAVLAVDITTLPNYQSLQIINDGSDGNAAIIRATGPVDLFEYVNPRSQVGALLPAGLDIPPNINDDPLPLDVQTDYILEPGADFVIERTTLINQDPEDLQIYLGEFFSGSGEVDTFMPPLGMGEPLVTLPCGNEKAVCAAGECDPCNMVGFIGQGGGEGVSYGRVHKYDGSSSLSQAGVAALTYGVNLLGVLAEVEQPNFEVPGDGQLVLEDRYFLVTSGALSSLQKVRNSILGYETGNVSGQVALNGQGIEGVLVSLVRPGEAGPPLMMGEDEVQMSAPTYDVVSVDRTDASGQYDFEVPPGEYEVRVYKRGHGMGTTGNGAVTVGAGTSVSRDFTLPEAGYLAVTVVDGDSAPVPAKVQLVGIDETKPEGNEFDLLAALDPVDEIVARAGLFFDQYARDPLPFGIAFVDFADADGLLPARRVVPGDYELVVSRGGRYSAFRQPVTIVAGETAEVTATIERVVDTPGFISADFHVHGIDSLDSRITRADRLAAFLAEGLDFFTPSDHGIQTNFAPDIQAAGVGHLIGTAPSAELTTPDYGHFNAWPRYINPDIPSGGSTDWGWSDVPAGERFPALGNYLMSPEQLITAAKDDPVYSPVVQINHINSFFSEVGLGVDTGVDGPVTTVPPENRRLDPALDGDLFSDDFDALEIWIGVNSRGGLGTTMDENMADWFNLINQGIVRTGVASSDTHVLRLTSMATRSMVASNVEDPGQLSDHAQTLADTVAEGRVFVTNAPFIEVTIDADGGTAGLALEHELEVASGDGFATVNVFVRSPEWAEFDRINLYINNAPEQKSADPPRYTVCADEVLDAGTDFTVEMVDGAWQTEASFALEGLTDDTWVVVKVEGTDGVSEPLFPVEPNSLFAAGNNSLADLSGSNLGQGGVLATAISNPLFINVTGGAWSAPGVALGSCD